MQKISITYNALIKYLEELDLQHIEKDGKIIPSDNFIKLENFACQKCSPEQIYEIAKLGLKSTNIKKLGEVIINSKDLKLNYWFARKFEGADVKAHEKIVLESQDPELNYDFARNVKGADVLAHGRMVIASKDPELNYDFATDVKGADAKAHGQVIIDSKDPELNYMFATYVKEADILAHARVLYKKDKHYFKQLIENLKNKGISFEYDENGKPVKVLSRPDQIIENFDNIEIE